MINLLPADYKKEIRAARSNVILLRYNITTLAAIVFLVLICGVFYVILSENKRAAEQLNNESIAKAQAYNDTKVQADQYRQNLKTAKQILDNEVNYTSLIFDITKLLPTGVVLDGLSLQAADFGKQTVLVAKAKNYDAVTKLKKNLQEASIFEKDSVYFQNINDGTGIQASGPYPISVSISVNIKKVTK